ncbi:MAG: QcrA and Rieske domain-containing protein [Thermogutta sp.]
MTQPDRPLASSGPTCSGSQGPAGIQQGPGQLSSQPRRGVLGSVVAWILGICALGPSLLAGIAAFLSPLAGKAQKGILLRLTTLDNLPKDGTPRKFPVIAEKRNGWTFSREPVGAVYLRLLPTGEVQALHVVCPHAGCAIEYRAGDAGGKNGEFVCPCHLAHFDLSGKRLDKVSPSPRDMDSLRVEIRDTEVWVEFQNFQLGTAAKLPVA